MHNPTRRVKRFKQPLSSTRPLTETNFNFVPGEGSGSTNNSNHVRHRQAAQPDTLRGAMLVALVVVTIVLYIVLWELERASFISVPRPNLARSALAASSSRGTSGAAPTRYPPAVAQWQDDPVSSSGEGYYLSNDRVAVSSSKPGPTTPPNTWPPPITRVPGEHDTKDLAETADHKNEITDVLSSFDTAYCNGACRFLLPVRVGEQESKARVHFVQLLVLAKRLDRTIVLPNVGKSRMSACSEWPFGAYYDTNGFAHGSDSPDSPLAIDLERFAKWVDERPISPNSFLISMDSIRQDRRDLLGTQTDSKDVPFVVEKAELDPKILSCLESKLARLRSSLPETALAISFDSGPQKTESDVSSRLVRLLSNGLDLDADSDFDSMMEPGYEYTPQYTNSSHLSLADIDVLVLDYDLRHPLFAASESVLANFNLHYAPALYDLADRLSDNLGPFLGVHWRMENVPVQNLVWCAASLISTLHALLQDDATRKKVEHVWLATDHPRPLSSFMDVVRFLQVDDDRILNGIESSKDGSPLRNYGPLRKSSTFKVLSLEHDDAIGILTEAFQPGGELETWTLTDLAEQLRRYPYVEGRFDVNETLLDDPGVFGILDKLVIVQARVFVSGSKDCSKTSSFSKQVIEARRETFEAERGKGVVHKVVEHFGN